jgi:hypothetical protein
MEREDKVNSASEIEVTEEMIEAACDAIDETGDKFLTTEGIGYRLDGEMISLIFRVMTRKREEHRSALSGTH